MTSDFFSANAQTRARETIQKLEASTSAEVVIAIRRSSGRYREIDYAFGAFTSFISLLLFLFLPMEIPIESFPIDALVAFAFGVFVCANTPWLRRVLTPKGRLSENVHNAARLAFLELGVSRTSGRTGILIYGSTLERRAEIISDLTAHAVLPRDAVSAIAAKASLALSTGNLDAFYAAVAELSPLLSASLPRVAGDVNELSDNMSVG